MNRMLVGLCLLALALAQPSVGQAQEPLTLRVSDLSGRPGDVVAVVLRTYAPRQIKQGQVCLRWRRGGGVAGVGGDSPFTGIDRMVVFSQHDDVEGQATYEPGGAAEVAMMEFVSPTSGINWADGPLAVLYLHLSASVSPGDVIEVEVDPLNTSLLDPLGVPIDVDVRPGELTVLGPAAPHELEAEGDVVTRGAVATLGVATTELFPIGSGQVGFRYDPAIAGGPPVVTMDPRYGASVHDDDASQPGLVWVSFFSLDGSLNEVTGSFITIALPTSPTVPVGTNSIVHLDPALTFLLDPSGQPWPLALGSDTVEFERGDRFFSDGFESGGLDAWSATVP